MPLFPVASKSDDGDWGGDDVTDDTSWLKSRSATAAVAPAPAVSVRKREPVPHRAHDSESRSDGKRRRHHSPPSATTTRPQAQAYPSADVRATTASDAHGKSNDASWFADSGGDKKNLEFESLYKGDVAVRVCLHHCQPYLSRAHTNTYTHTHTHSLSLSRARDLARPLPRPQEIFGCVMCMATEPIERPWGSIVNSLVRLVLASQAYRRCTDDCLTRGECLRESYDVYLFCCALTSVHNHASVVLTSLWFNCA